MNNDYLFMILYLLGRRLGLWTILIFFYFCVQNYLWKICYSNHADGVAHSEAHTNLTKKNHCLSINQGEGQKLTPRWPRKKNHNRSKKWITIPNKPKLMGTFFIRITRVPKSIWNADQIIKYVFIFIKSSVLFSSYMYRLHELTGISGNLCNLITKNKHRI